MNNSETLRFCPWHKPEVVFTLLDWRPHEGLAFVVGADKRRQVIRFDLPGLLAHAYIGFCVAFPRAAPTTIIETSLLPPPCRTTEKEAECLIAAAAEARSPSSRTQSCKSSDLPDWELVWLGHRNEVLLPLDEDRTEIERRLEVFKAEMRQKYEERKQELEDWRTKTIGQMIYLGGGRFYRELRNWKPASLLERVELHMHVLETAFTLPLSECQGRLYGGYLNWTPEVARHEPTIRNPILHERWATKHHLKLVEMNTDKEAFLKWYWAQCPAPRPPASNVVMERMSPGICARIADDALCAEIRFVANFSDGSRVWLADCPRRDPLLTIEEQRPFEAPVPVSTPAGQSLDSTAARTDDDSRTLDTAKNVLVGLEAVVPKLAAERQQLEAVPGKIAATTKDLNETLGKVPDIFAEPLVAAAKAASEKQGVPPLFAWWVFREWHDSKFPTVDGALRRCGLGPQLEKDGFGFSRSTVGRWLKIIYEELEERKLMPKRNLSRGAVKAPDFDVAQATDSGPLPGDEDEPPDEFVEWAQDKHAAGAMPSEEDVMDWLCARAASDSLDPCSDDKLREIAKKWLRQAAKILDSV